MSKRCFEQRGTFAATGAFNGIFNPVQGLLWGTQEDDSGCCRGAGGDWPGWPALGQSVASPMSHRDHGLRVFEGLARVVKGFLLRAFSATSRVDERRR
ncbi:hypothetical protein [Schlesneria sp. DSM 10557]|uniref:hypothetical protein n=1 Tax=Schlesneria sp. DSM 10557 TaxID=3044399 RepID=UPI0035A02D81